MRSIEDRLQSEATIRGRVALRGVIFSVCAVVALFFVACRESTETPRPGEEGRTASQVKPLNEVPIEQLRVTLKGYAGDWRNDSAMSQGVEAPPAEKAVAESATRIDLVPAEKLSFGEMPLREAIATRRSQREFSAASLSLEELSFLLWSSQGVTGQVLDDEGRTVQNLRAAPSAGGRFPLETYLAIDRVEGLEAGVYRYLPSAHQLILVRADEAIAGKIKAAAYGQTFVGEAAVVFLWAAVPYRTEWKYAYLSHRMIAMEAGHVCQNLYLAAEAIEAGTCALLSYDQASVDAMLGIDGVDEFVVYLACLGKTKPPGN